MASAEETESISVVPLVLT